MPVETAHGQETRERTGGTDGRDAASSTCHGAVWVGVVRSPPSWFRRRVDYVYSALDIPTAASEALERRRRDLQMRGLCAEGAHNAAWEELKVDERYRAYLSSAEARKALQNVRTLTARERVVLATDRRPGFRCHRSVLASVLE